MEHYIIKKPIEQDFIDRATRMAPKKAFNDRSMTNGERNMLGTLAELYMFEVLYHLTPNEADLEHTGPTNFDYDLLCDGLKWDVKVKQRKYEVVPEWDASILDYSLKSQKCDGYLFCSITVSPKPKEIPMDFYFVGCISKDEYRRTASFRKMGERDGENKDRNGQPYRNKGDCWNLKYSQLRQFSHQTLSTLTDHGYTLIKW